MLPNISDHSIDSISLKLPADTLGNGEWKCNINTLKDGDFKADLTKLCERRLKILHEVSPHDWDSFKLKCRDLIKIHSKRLPLVSKLRYKNLQKEYHKNVTLEDVNPGSFHSAVQYYESEINNN